MAVDEAILIVHGEGSVPPTLRFYAWDPPTLSIGYFQRAEKEIDFESLRRRGYGFVRRPTGGRAVLHDREVTYSVVVSESYPGMPESVTESYRVISEGLVRGLRRMGLDAGFARPDEEQRKRLLEPGSAACFDSPSWYEVVVEGRKLIGSAQTRQRGVILQHGSLLLELDARALFGVLRFPSEKVRERLLRSFLHHAVALGDLTGGKVSREEVEKALVEGFADALGVEMVPGELTDRERTLAETLVREKYGSDAWNFRR
ncbi:MAG: biotin/lipoate A/B protein ligase family protein [Alicyclobacillaceae bacterium]|nr:biotin/lipoate A/B protein ligase family protein [Alicyclobacillaceae bacterium]